MADPHLLTPVSDLSVGLGASAMDTEEETGEKSGGKGVEYKADGENVNVAALIKISHTRSSRLNTRLVPYRHIEMCIEPCCTAASQIVQVILILQT
jgi:uncharacterized spore protein YtfJ